MHPLGSLREFLFREKFHRAVRCESALELLCSLTSTSFSRQWDRITRRVVPMVEALGVGPFGGPMRTWGLCRQEKKRCREHVVASCRAGASVSTNIL